MNKALFLDRDGVLNIDRGYVSRIDDFDFVPGVFETLRLAQARGYKLIIVTNQSGIARGLYTEDDYQQLTSWMLAQLEGEEIFITQVYHCPFHVDGVVPELSIESDLRKPNPGMLLRAQEEHQLDMGESIMVGDKLTDIEAGQRAKVGITVFVGEETGGKVPADKSVGSLVELPAALGWNG